MAEPLSAEDALLLRCAEYELPDGYAVYDKSKGAFVSWEVIDAAQSTQVDATPPTTEQQEK